MAKVFKSGLFLKPRSNNEIEGARVQHLETSNTIRSFLHIDNSPVTIIAPFLEAAINMANGMVSMAILENDQLYYEFALKDGRLCSVIVDEDNELVKYEFDEELDKTNELWILATIILCQAMQETGARELRDVFASIKMQVGKNDTVLNDDAFILCDYLCCRLASRTKTSLDIDLDTLEKERRLTLSTTGDLLSIKEDITPKFTGKEGVFERVAIALESNTSTTREERLGKGNYLFLEDEIKESEKPFIPVLKGVVETFEMVDAIETIYDARNREQPKNIIFSIGQSGVGKSFFFKVLASELGLPYYTISGDEDAGSNIFKGQWVIEDGNMNYKPSYFMEKIQQPCVFEIAECSSFLATKLTQIYPLLDKDCMSLVNEDGVTIRRHPHCIVGFTSNNYACLNDIPPSLVARAATILRLPMMDRDNLRKVILKENGNEPIDSNIMENVLDCMEKIETYLSSPNAPRGCESSIRGYAAWADKIQNSKNRGRYNPIYAARTTILPIISSGMNFDETIEKTIIESIIAPTFNFYENGGV